MMQYYFLLSPATYDTILSSYTALDTNHVTLCLYVCSTDDAVALGCSYFVLTVRCFWKQPKIFPCAIYSGGVAVKYDQVGFR